MDNYLRALTDPESDSSDCPSLVQKIGQATLRTLDIGILIEVWWVSLIGGAVVVSLCNILIRWLGCIQSVWMRYQIGFVDALRLAIWVGMEIQFLLLHHYILAWGRLGERTGHELVVAGTVWCLVFLVLEIEIILRSPHLSSRNVGLICGICSNRTISRNNPVLD